MVDWEVITGVATVLSTVCTVGSTIYFAFQNKDNVEAQRSRLISLDKFMAFLLASSGWALICLCFLWVFKPFGGFPMDQDWLQFYGVVLAFPALIIFKTGIKILGLVQESGTETNK